MRRFEQDLKDKAHMSKIKHAKTTLASTTKPPSKLNASKIGAEAQLLLELYDKKNYDAIPAYKLLRTAGLQQYTRGFIQRGYGINVGKLANVTGEEKTSLYEDLKIMPGHTIKLNKIIESIVSSSYSMQNTFAEAGESREDQREEKKLKVLTRKDTDYEKQLERVLNEYTPSQDPKKKIA